MGTLGVIEADAVVPVSGITIGVGDGVRVGTLGVTEADAFAPVGDITVGVGVDAGSDAVGGIDESEHAANMATAARLTSPSQ